MTIRKRGLDAPINEKPEDFYQHALTHEEEEVCRNIMMFGPEYLRSTRKWNAVKVKSFLERAEIKREIETLRRQYEDRSGIQERTQFFAQVKVNSMVPAALNIMARALRGEYKDPTDGHTVPAPTPQQVSAAQDILGRANIQGGKYAGNDAVPSIDARSIQIAIGGSTDTHSLDSKGREKVRNILSNVMNRTRAIASSERRREVRSEPVDQPEQDED
jgi:hypothetical protein